MATLACMVAWSWQSRPASAFFFVAPTERIIGEAATTPVAATIACGDRLAVLSLVFGLIEICIVEWRWHSACATGECSVELVDVA